MYEPTELDTAMAERAMMNLPLVGPLTRDQAQSMDAYEAYMQEQEAEYEASQAAGGRTICPECGQRTVKHSSVYTIGWEGHPGAEQSDFAQCESCDYKEL